VPRKKNMGDQWEQSYLYSNNAAFVEALYAAYLHNPDDVEPHWRTFFASLQPTAAAADVDHALVRQEFITATRRPRPLGGADLNQALAQFERKQIAVLQLINAFRFRGHQAADVDPLGLLPRGAIPDLMPSSHGLTDSDLDLVFNTGSLVGPDKATLRDIIRVLGETYCHHVGAEYMHITSTAQKRWLQERLEASRARPNLAPESKKQILSRLLAAEGLEKYLHTKYVGQKRFSLEGGESLIPLLDTLLQSAGAQGVEEVVTGMAHRGRLNVLINVLGKSPSILFQEFEGHFDPSTNEGSGDVKYHQGFSSDVATPGGTLHLALAFNPSHLEIISPVVEGSVRARQQRRHDHGGKRVLPILIHGDAAFAGQGVVMETFNMSQARGYTTGGSLHVIINNQIGFTTSNPLDSRSTAYCTEVARMVQAPIFHVNGDDPEAVVFVTELAFDFRQQFRKDVVIDLVCYRRHGHSEADEPAATQPLMYQKIRRLPTVARSYANKLMQDNIVTEDAVKAMDTDYRAALDAGKTVAPNVIVDPQMQKRMVDWSPYLKTHWTASASTQVPPDVLLELNQQLTKIPEGFQLHPRVAKILEERIAMAADEMPSDWGFAETLAYAALLRDGFSVRLSGQDSGRGTFFHRHAVLHHQSKDESYVPLHHINSAADFTVIDSLLSEEAVLAYEYGFSATDPHCLTIWEAQFGDFANNAQVVFDQFISSGESKWGRLSGLTMFLPHGYDGQGPEHSSARMERYLQLCAEENIQVIVPTMPAQMFHLLRRQMLRPFRKPLIVFTPKSLLRHKDSASPLRELTDGAFRPIIDDEEAVDTEVRRLIVCCGKVYFELIEARRKRELKDTAIVRIEQLYPFPEEPLLAMLNKYSKAKTLVWTQEEPQNQGAWSFVQPRLGSLLKGKQRLHYAGRPAAAAPAVGYLKKHIEQQRQLLDDAFAVS
jgi:2-oxoglutarate dehydrogenase E1 component